MRAWRAWKESAGLSDPDDFAYKPLHNRWHNVLDGGLEPETIGDVITRLGAWVALSFRPTGTPRAAGWPPAPSAPAATARSSPSRADGRRQQRRDGRPLRGRRRLGGGRPDQGAVGRAEGSDRPDARASNGAGSHQPQHRPACLPGDSVRGAESEGADLRPHRCGRPVPSAPGRHLLRCGGLPPAGLARCLLRGWRPSGVCARRAPCLHVRTRGPGRTAP